MSVNDRQVYIGTQECRLSSWLCARRLNKGERSPRESVLKPCHISSRVRRTLFVAFGEQRVRTTLSKGYRL